MCDILGGSAALCSVTHHHPPLSLVGFVLDYLVCSFALVAILISSAVVLVMDLRPVPVQTRFATELRTSVIPSLECAIENCADLLSRLGTSML
jgi:hypothetical protein